MTINLALASTKSTGSTTTRTFGARFSDIINVKDYGAVGDSTTDDTSAIQAAFNAAFGTSAAPNGLSTALNKAVFFPAGSYLISSALTLTAVVSGHIYGAGRQNSIIKYNTGTNGNVINTNGFEYCRIENLGFTCASDQTGICFNLDWDNTGDAALQANSFIDCAFGGGDYGVIVGSSGFMGSENLFLNCHFTSCHRAGIRVANQNALDQTIIGGGIAGCASVGSGAGIWIVGGSCQTILNIGFAQGDTAYDIRNDAADPTAVVGCRTESANFISAPGGSWSIIGCVQSNNSSGYFIHDLNGACTIQNCTSTIGKINGNHGALDLAASNFNLMAIVPVLVSNVTSGAAGVIRITMPTSPYSAPGLLWATGERVTIAGVVGTGGLTAAANGTFTVTQISSTVLDLQGTSFVGAYTSGGTVSPAADSFLTGYNGSTAKAPARDWRRTYTASGTLTRGMSGMQIDNLGATGTVTLTLPTMQDSDDEKPGIKYGFYVGAAQTLEIVPANNMTLRIGSSVSTAGTGKVSSNTLGNYIEIECIDGSNGVDSTKWVTKSHEGTWTVT